MTTRQSNKAAPKPTNSSNNTRVNGARVTNITAPLAQGRQIRTSRPNISGSPYTGDGRVTVKHREYIGQVAGSVVYGSTTYPINPGMPQTFPWLSVMAQDFESYRFKKLNFIFETEKSASTNGSIMMAVDYDAADAAPTSKVELMANNHAVRSQVWAPVKYMADAPDLHKLPQRYNRYGALSSNLDIKTYDVGNLIVATQGCADTTSLGELYTEYEVELLTPQLGPNLSQIMTGAGSVSKTAIFGTAPTSSGTGFFSGSGSVLTALVPGEFLVEVSVAGTGLAFAPIASTGTATLAATVGGTALTTATASWAVRLLAGQTLTFDYSGSTTLTNSVTRITKYQYSLL